MRTNNLFHSANYEVLGIVHVFIRQLLSRFYFLRDQGHPFLRTVTQTLPGIQLPSFSVTSHDEDPMWLTEAVDVFNLLIVRFQTEYLASVPKKKL